MSRPRVHDAGLPAHVVRRHGAFYFIHPTTRRWKRLAPETDLAAMYVALGATLQGHTGAMSKLLDLYARDVLPHKALSTIIYQRPQLEALRTWLGDRDPDNVQPPEIASFLDHHPHPITANRIIALLSHVYTKGMRWGLATTNPCWRVERNAEHPRRRYVTDEELHTSVDNAPPPIALAMELAYATGQRRSDLLTLRWVDVRDEGVYFQQHKTGVELLMEYTEYLDDVLLRCRRAARSATHVLVNAHGQPWTTAAFKTAWRRFMTVDRRPHFQFKDLRKKSGNDATDGSHLGNDPRTFRHWYALKPRVVRGV